MRLNRKLDRLSIAEKIQYSTKIKQSDCILLYTPVHGNLGDHAIVQTQKQILSDYNFSYVEIPRDEIIMREKAFAKIIPKDKVLLIPGGGFLGSLWPREEYGFRNIIKAFPNNRIIVFPQTISFDCKGEGRDYFEESKRIYSGHKFLKLFVRDTFSYHFIKENMPEVDVSLVPDVVTSLKAEVITNKREGIRFFIRNDKEKVVSDKEFEEIKKIVNTKWANEDVKYGDTVQKGKIYPDCREQMIKQKLEEFSSAKLVVTDRLHGLLFSTITATPCIAFNNSNGKVAAQYSWIKNNDYVQMVSNIDEFRRAIETIDIEKTYKYDDSFVKEKMVPLQNALRSFVGGR